MAGNSPYVKQSKQTRRNYSPDPSCRLRKCAKTEEIAPGAGGLNEITFAHTVKFER